MRARLSFRLFARRRRSHLRRFGIHCQVNRIVREAQRQFLVLACSPSGQRVPAGDILKSRQGEDLGPKILALSRLQNVACRDALTGWAASQYEKLPLSFAHNSVYLAMNSEASEMTAPTSGK